MTTEPTSPRIHYANPIAFDAEESHDGKSKNGLQGGRPKVGALCKWTLGTDDFHISAADERASGACKKALEGSSTRYAAAKGKASEAGQRARDLQIKAELAHQDEESGGSSDTVKATFSLGSHGLGHGLKSTKAGIAVEVVLVTSYEFFGTSKKSDELGKVIISALSEVSVATGTARLATSVVGCNVATAGVAGAMVLKECGEKSEEYFANLSQEDRQTMASGWNKDPDGLISFETAITISRVPQLPGKGLSKVAHAVADVVTKTVHAVTETIDSMRPTTAKLPVK